MNWPSRAFVALSVTGIPIALYHASEELAFVPSNACNISQFLSCQTVFASGYTSLFGVPFYVYGLVWFPLMVVLGIVASQRFKILIFFVMLGNLFTAYLWYLDIFVINAYCIVCISMYVINYALTGVLLLNTLAGAESTKTAAPVEP